MPDRFLCQSWLWKHWTWSHRKEARAKCTISVSFFFFFVVVVPLRYGCSLASNSWLSSCLSLRQYSLKMFSKAHPQGWFPLFISESVTVHLIAKQSHVLRWVLLFRHVIYNSYFINIFNYFQKISFSPASNNHFGFRWSFNCSNFYFTLSHILFSSVTF